MSTAGVLTTAETSPRVRLQLDVQGAVQGVGFRPWIFRLATDLGLAGCVRNSPQGVTVEIEGLPAAIEAFLLRFESEPPPLSTVVSVTKTRLAPAGEGDFAIEESSGSGTTTAFILPDLASCPECLAEVFDPANRRYRYPFTNCTHCGPRFSIVEALPYDRANTTMRGFAMCELCREEYTDPGNRRFHAQPIACPACGPQVELWDVCGSILARTDRAVAQAARLIREGAILAVKGIGGFHLLANAHSDEVVQRLRLRKGREAKPFALMFLSVQAVRRHCDLEMEEERLLCSPAAPIVLLRAKADAPFLSPSIAPGSPLLGCMLAYTPLHHLLLAEVDDPVIATSGNRSDEPICVTEEKAIEQLDGIADAFLVHNRPIARPVDDSVVRVVLGRELLLRRARGFAPSPVAIPSLRLPALALGAHQKNTVALGRDNHGVVSQHLGDLDSPESLRTLDRTVDELQRIHKTHALAVVADAHPDYLSRRHAERSGMPVISVQHHYAHVLSCMVDNAIAAPVLGVAWDGAGYGADGTIWGGEFLRITGDGFERICHLRTFPLPGGEIAAREPRRCALGILYSIFGEDTSPHVSLNAFSEKELRALLSMLRQRLNAPQTSSAGRLFDAVASLLGTRQHASFEGQAAMELEFAAEECPSDAHYPFALDQSLDWEPMIRGILSDLSNGASPGVISAKFHNTLSELIVSVAHKAGEPRVALTGGCFQNKRLLERTITRLKVEGFEPYWHRQIPPNDGGISVGQLAAVSRTQP